MVWFEFLTIPGPLLLFKMLAREFPLRTGKNFLLVFFVPSVIFWCSGIRAEGLLLLSSRISVEMVQKAAMLGAPVVVAVSAPTALAVRLAEQAGITLIGIARADGFEVFTRPERITTQQVQHVA